MRIKNKIDASCAFARRVQNIPSSIETVLRSGRHVCLRPLRPQDERLIERGIRELSDQSRYFRFFSGFKQAPPSVVKRLADADGEDHIAWGMVDLEEEDNPAFAASHAIRNAIDKSTAEFSIAVLDLYHGQGAAKILMAAVLRNCLVEGIERLRIDILTANVPAMNLVKSIGAERETLDGPVSTYSVTVQRALESFIGRQETIAIRQVLSAFEAAPVKAEAYT